MAGGRAVRSRLEERDHATPDRLARNVPFLTICASAGLTFFARNTFNLAAYSMAINELHAGTFAASIVSALLFVPMVFLSPLIGSIVDRARRRRVAVLTDGMLAIATALLPLLAISGIKHLYLVYLLVALVGFEWAVYEAILATVMPQIVAKDKLVKASSLISGVRASGLLVGPLLGGVLVDTIGAGQTVAFSAIAYALATFAWFVIPDRLAQPRATGPAPSLVTQTREGFRHLRSSGPIRRITIASAGFNLGVGAVGGVFATFILNTHYLSLPSTEYGMIQASFSFAMLASMFGGPWAQRRFGMRRLMQGSVLLAAFAILLVPAAEIGVPLLFLLGYQFTFGTLSSIFWMCTNTVRQIVVAGHALGRVSALVNAITNVTPPIGSVAAGLIATQIGIIPVLITASGLSVLGSLLLMLPPGLPPDDAVSPVLAAAPRPPRVARTGRPKLSPGRRTTGLSRPGDTERRSRRPRALGDRK